MLEHELIGIEQDRRARKRRKPAADAEVKKEDVEESSRRKPEDVLEERDRLEVVVDSEENAEEGRVPERAPRTWSEDVGALEVAPRIPNEERRAIRERNEDSKHQPEKGESEERAIPADEPRRAEASGTEAAASCSQHFVTSPPKRDAVRSPPKRDAVSGCRRWFLPGAANRPPCSFLRKGYGTPNIRSPRSFLALSVAPVATIR